jgi:3-dehydroquinate synthase
MKQRLIFTNRPGEAIDGLVAGLRPANVYVIVDANTEKQVLPLLSAMSEAVAGAKTICVGEGDVNKNLDSLASVWTVLNETGATRSSLVLNVGGGMVTDMGGFAAATFKRGMRFINVPTTLLAAVDASVGGKTGVNFNGCKNEIGVFAESEAAVISTVFFDTLPVRELLSGYAEMLKHALLDNRKTFCDLLDYSFAGAGYDKDRLLELLKESVAVKERIVAEDLHEHGIRKALNLGHTTGHAFESFAMAVRHSPIPHGYAVAWGMVVELILSRMLTGFPSDMLQRYVAYVRDNYGAFDFTCDDYSRLLGFMAHDKKNPSADRINFSLLGDVGDVVIDTVVDIDNIKAALDIYRDMTGI